MLKELVYYTTYAILDICIKYFTHMSITTNMYSKHLFLHLIWNQHKIKILKCKQQIRRINTIFEWLTYHTNTVSMLVSFLATVPDFISIKIHLLLVYLCCRLLNLPLYSVIYIKTNNYKKHPSFTTLHRSIFMPCITPHHLFIKTSFLSIYYFSVTRHT